MPQRRIIKKANGITRTATNTEIKSPDRFPSEFSRSTDKCNSITVPRTFNYYSGLSFLQYLGSLHLAKSSGHRCRRCDPPRYYKFRKGLLEHQRLHHPPADWNEEDVQKFMESRTLPSPKPLKPFIRKDKQMPKHRKAGRPPKKKRRAILMANISPKEIPRALMKIGSPSIPEKIMPKQSVPPSSGKATAAINTMAEFKEMVAWLHRKKAQ